MDFARLGLIQKLPASRRSNQRRNEHHRDAHCDEELEEKSHARTQLTMKD